MKVVVVGNSIGLRIRPPAPFPNNKNFGAYLEEELKKVFAGDEVCVDNLCVGRSTIWDITCRADEILRQFPDYYVVCIGVTDASTREIPLWYSNIINAQCVSLKRNLLNAIYVKLIKPWRPLLVRLRGGRTWTSARDFEKYLNLFLQLLLKGTNAQLLVLTINDTSDRVERQLPGSRHNYSIYNSILEEACEQNRITLIDTRGLDVPADLPDGIHYSPQGHRKVAFSLLDSIIKLENSRLKNGV